MVKGKAVKKGNDDLLEKFARLTEQNAESSRRVIERVDRLVSLFEEASKHVTDVETTEAKINMLTQRLQELLEQNKSVAQGLILLERYVRGKTRLEEGMAGPKPVAEYGPG